MSNYEAQAFFTDQCKQFYITLKVLHNLAPLSYMCYKINMDMQHYFNYSIFIFIDYADVQPIFNVRLFDVLNQSSSG